MGCHRNTFMHEPIRFLMLFSARLALVCAMTCDSFSFAFGSDCLYKEAWNEEGKLHIILFLLNLLNKLNRRLCFHFCSQLIWLRSLVSARSYIKYISLINNIYGYVKYSFSYSCTETILIGLKNTEKSTYYSETRSK